MNWRLFVKRIQEMDIHPRYIFFCLMVLFALLCGAAADFDKQAMAWVNAILAVISLIIMMYIWGD